MDLMFPNSVPVKSKMVQENDEDTTPSDSEIKENSDAPPPSVIKKRKRKKRPKAFAHKVVKPVKVVAPKPQPVQEVLPEFPEEAMVEEIHLGDEAPTQAEVKVDLEERPIVYFHTTEKVDADPSFGKEIVELSKTAGAVQVNSEVVTPKWENLLNESKTVAVTEVVDTVQAKQAKSQTENITEKLEMSGITANPGVAPKTEVENKSETDELVFYDYSGAKRKTENVNEEPSVAGVAPSATATAEVATQDNKGPRKLHDAMPISSSVSQAIERAKQTMGSPASAKKKPIETFPLPQNLAQVDQTLEQNVKNPKKYLAQVDTQQKSTKTPPSAPQVKRPAKVIPYKNSSVVIRTIGVDFNSKVQNNLRDYEVRPNYDYGVILNDDQGRLVLEESLHEGLSVMGASVVKQGHLPTNVDVSFEEGDFEVQVPLFDLEKLENYLNKNNINGEGGLVLVDLHEDTEDTDLDAEYSKKLYLNNSFKVVKSNQEHRYVLYVGVRPGNVFISYKNFNGKTGGKFIHVVDSELYFEINSYVNTEMDEFELVENRVFGSMESMPEVADKDIRYFNTKIQSKKRGLNVFELKNPLIPLGTRKYIEVKQDDELLFFGKWDARTLQLPSKDFREQIYKAYGLENLKNHCVIQFNLKNRPKEFKYSGRTTGSGMELIAIYADKDGTFNDEISIKTDKIFLKGEFEGVVDVRVNYANKTTDFFQTYCYQNTHLVEQL